MEDLASSFQFEVSALLASAVLTTLDEVVEGLVPVHLHQLWPHAADHRLILRVFVLLPARTAWITLFFQRSELSFAQLGSFFRYGSGGQTLELLDQSLLSIGELRALSRRRYALACFACRLHCFQGGSNVLTILVVHRADHFLARLHFRLASKQLKGIAACL